MVVEYRYLLDTVLAEWICLGLIWFLNVESQDREQVLILNGMYSWHTPGVKWIFS